MTVLLNRSANENNEYQLPEIAKSKEALEEVTEKKVEVTLSGMKNSRKRHDRQEYIRLTS